MERIFVFDTTLRDGEQTPGITFSLKEKHLIAQALDEVGIDVIEGGFPVISDGDFECCKTLAKLGLKSEIIGLARCNKEDIDAVIKADMDSIHVFIATSDLHLREKLKLTREEVLNQITESVIQVNAVFQDHIHGYGIIGVMGAGHGSVPREIDKIPLFVAQRRKAERCPYDLAFLLL